MNRSLLRHVAWFFWVWFAVAAIVATSIAIAVIWGIVRLASEEPIPAAQSAPPMVGREPFGSLVSPDGRWLLEERSSDAPNAPVDNGDAPIAALAREHHLVARSLHGQGERDILVRHEGRNADFTPLTDTRYRFTSSWTPAGWSTDGARAYYVAMDDTDGLGGYYPNRISAYGVLYEVDVATGGERALTGPTMFLDIDVPHGNVLIETVRGSGSPTGPTGAGSAAVLSVADLALGHRQEIALPSDAEGISLAVFDPTGQHIALETYTRPTDDFHYRFEVVNRVTGARVSIIRDEVADGSGQFGWWYDAKTLEFAVGIGDTTLVTVPNVR